MKKIPVYKECPECQGKGTIEKSINYSYFSNSGIKNIDTCSVCNGTGKIDTGMFIEDPYSLFDV